MSDDDHKQPEWGIKLSRAFCIPQRFIISIFGMLAILNAYSMRICLNIVIVKIVKSHNYTKSETEKMCPPDQDLDEDIEGSGEYDWSQELQGFILSSFYIGYLISHIPGGILADKYGSKWVLSLGVLSTAVFTALTPLCIKVGGAVTLIMLRILMGLGEGTVFPALSVLVADWVPLEERGVLGAIVMGGGQLGIIIGNSLTDWLLDQYEWQWTFYFWACVATLWFIFFILLCFNNPHKHPFIKAKELEYLTTAVGKQSDKRRDLPLTPFKQIFNSISLWSLVAAQIGHDWAFYVISSDLPKYFHNVLQINTRKNELYSSVPSGTMWVCSILSGIIADLLLKKKVMGVTNIRKTMTAIGAFGPAIFLMAASYSNCNRVSVVINFCLCMALMGAYYAGMKLTSVDMSPNYAGILMAITNGIGSLTGVISPIVISWMTPDTTLFQWRFVFWMTFILLIVTAIIYCVWASGEIQPWNNPEQNQDNSKDS